MRHRIVPSFIFIAFGVLKLYMSKVSCTTKKGHFGLLLDGFCYITTPNQVGFLQNFDQWCSAMQSITCVMVFDIVFKIRKMEPKNPFLGGFFDCFPATPPETLSATPKSFVEWRVSWRYTILPSFISIAFVVLKLKIFKKFRGDGASMNWAILGGFWTLTPPNMVRSCWNLHQR